MPIYDYDCQYCGNSFETIAGVDEQRVRCPKCNGEADRVISVSGVFCSNEDAEWIRSVREVVDKDGGAHCQEFLKNPTRQNYKNWMNGEGLRPLEPGEKPRKPKPPDQNAIKKEMMERYSERHRITIR